MDQARSPLSESRIAAGEAVTAAHARKARRRATLPRESQAVEWKESISAWKEIVETAAAFATAGGGRVYVGVTRKGDIRGIVDGEKSQEDITNRITQNTDPRTVPSVRVETFKKKDLLVIEIDETRAKPVHAFGRPFKRSGRTNQRLSPDQAAEIYMASRGQTWDETILDDVNRSDIAMKRVRSFVAAARRERKVEWSGKDAPARALRHLKLINRNKPTVAALLLFGTDPHRHLVQSEIRCARFKLDSDERPIDFEVISGTVFDQADEVLRFVERNIAMSYEIRDGGPRRTNIWQYPLDAIREGVVNAICHRDYTSTANVQVRIFDESLEIWNPGLLPPGLSVRDLKRSHESKPRNKLIASAFFLAGVIERFGQGTQKIVSLCRDAGLPDPEFEERGASFIVRFRAAIPQTTPQVRPKSGPSRAQVELESRLTSQLESALSRHQVGTKSTAQVTAEVAAQVITFSRIPRSAREIMAELGLKHWKTFQQNYLLPLINVGLLERTIPDKPNSRLQKYRLTAKGRRLITHR